MKTSFISPLIFLGCCVFGLVQPGIAQQNLITNGNMEARNRVPQNSNNIGFSGSNGDLQNWYKIPAPESNDMTPDYLATDGSGFAGTTTGGIFSPHSGIGCVGLSQHGTEGAHFGDELITQRLAQPLLRGHSYRAEFYALRRLEAPWETKLAFYVTNGDPTFYANQKIFSPSVGNKLIVSDIILDRQLWKQVTGTIDIPYSEVNNQWVTVGYWYDKTYPHYNASLSSTLRDIYYAVDDVALYDLGCGIKVSGHYYCNDGCPSYPPTQGDLVTGKDFYTVPAGTYTVDISTGITGANVSSWTWNVQSDGPYTIRSSGNQQGVVTLRANQRAQFTVSGDVSGCGPISRTFTLAAYGTYSYAYAPNPTSDELTVTVVDGGQPATAEPSTTAAPFDAELYDCFGKKVKTKKSENGRTKLDVRDLPNGLYNLRAGKGEEAISERTVPH